MNNSQAIEATLFVSPHPDVVKRASVPSLILSSALIVAGLGVFISAFQLNDKASSIGMLLLVVGTAALLMGVFRLFWKIQTFGLCSHRKCNERIFSVFRSEVHG